MRIILFVICAPAFAALMPMPATVVPGTGSISINASFAVDTSACADDRVTRAAARLVERIGQQTGIDIRGGKTVLFVACAASGAEYPKLGEDESYQLDVSADGAHLRAATADAALHGMETFAEWIDLGAAGFENGFEARAVHIEDRPRFPWRGLMIDVSRHWMPLPVVLRNLDAMAAVKLNVFHWHLSDDQGFRVESKRFPKLQQSGSDDHFYTQQEVRRVVDYARDRGIRVVPEFDMPGHTTSWFAGYPELASAPGPYLIERNWGIFQPTMDPSREETFKFLDAFLGEMTALFPDPYFHIGGDEVDPAQWTRSQAIQAWASRKGLKDAHAIQRYFNQHVEKILAAHGKTMIGWDEVFDGDLNHNTVIQSWRGQASLADAARAGFRGVLSSGYYLDHLEPAAAHYAVDPVSGAAAKLSEEEKSRILGGEACMWTEYVDAETVDSRIWPSAAAVAERLWSPVSVIDADSVYQRLEQVSRMLDWVGLKHRSVYEPMLERLAGEQSADSLRVLADASEALGIDARQSARKYNSLVPLNRFVDAVRPESETVRRMERAARNAVNDPGSASPDLITILTAWSQNNAHGGEWAELSKNLSISGTVGLKAMEYLRSGKPAPQDWVAAQTAALDQMEKPVGEVRLAAVGPVRVLVLGAARSK